MDFGFRKKHKFNFGEKTERTHCPRCMRTREEAINDQLMQGGGCDDPNCYFAQVIKQALDNRKQSFCINCGHQFNIGDIFCIVCGCRRIDD